VGVSIHKSPRQLVSDDVRMALVLRVMFRPMKKCLGIFRFLRRVEKRKKERYRHSTDEDRIPLGLSNDVSDYNNAKMKRKKTN
jgi:hypothetical protein